MPSGTAEKYTCNYLHNSGNICSHGCRRPEGCYEHWKSKKRIYAKSAVNYYIMQFYSRKLRMAKSS